MHYVIRAVDITTGQPLEVLKVKEVSAAFVTTLANG